MPEVLASEESFYATPADLAFLAMLPGAPPTWFTMRGDNKPESQDEWQRLLNGIVYSDATVETAPALLHLNFPLNSTSTYQAEVEMIACFYEGSEPSAEEVFRIHDYLPGRVELPRASNHDIVVSRNLPIGYFPREGGGRILPALIPSVASYVGYFQSDLTGRMPYLPANYSDSADLVARSRSGGMDLIYGDQGVGEIRYWNWQWSPGHERDLGPQCGVSLEISKKCGREMLSVLGARFSRCWRAKVLTKDRAFGEWDEKIYFGSLPGPLSSM
jgi:hypothetical protein